jgi:hypothetical protein
MKKTVYFLIILVCVFFTFQYSYSQDDTKNVSSVISQADRQKLAEADLKNEEAQNLLAEADEKITNLLLRKKTIDNKRGELDKAKSNLRSISKFKQKLAFKKKRKVKRLQKELSNLTRTQNITALEQEVNELLEKVKSMYASKQKYDIYNVYVNKYRSLAKYDQEVKQQGQSLEQNARNQMDQAASIRNQSADFNVISTNLKKAYQLELLGISDQLEALRLYLTTKTKKQVMQNANVIYKIQILALIEAPISDQKLRQIYNLNQSISKEETEGWYKYSVGQFTTYQQAAEVKSSIDINGAFIIAYRNGVKINIEEAKRLTGEYVEEE